MYVCMYLIQLATHLFHPCTVTAAWTCFGSFACREVCACMPLLWLLALGPSSSPSSSSSSRPARLGSNIIERIAVGWAAASRRPVQYYIAVHRLIFMHAITSIQQGTLQTKIQTNIKPRNILDRGSMCACQYDAASSTGKAAAIAPTIHTYTPASEQRMVSRRAYPHLLFHRGRCYGRLDSSDAMHPIHTPTAAPRLQQTITATMITSCKHNNNGSKCHHHHYYHNHY